jgi:hypothetical protein
MIDTEPKMICERSEETDCEELGVCTILFEAPTLRTLSGILTRWLMTHRRYRPISFSHAFETRWEPVASLAGPRPLSVYTGVLLVHSTSRSNEQI